MPVVHRKSRSDVLRAPVAGGVVQTIWRPVRQAWGMTTAPPRRLTVLSGGVGGARFLQGLLHAQTVPDGPGPLEITVVANTADDLWLHGLKICPDLDTVMYTLGDGIDHDRGWGRRDETWSVKEELAAYGAEAPWFGLGDRDIATHLMRTRMLEAGYPLSQVTEALCARWLTPVFGDGVRLLPMSDDRVETHVAIADPDSPSGTPGRALPGVLGAPARRGARRDRRRGRARGVDAGAGCPGGDRRRRRGRRTALQPGGLRRHDPRGARASARRCARRPRRSWASPPSSAAPTCAGWRSSC